MLKYAVLIDAGFVKRKIGTAAAPASSTNYESFLEDLKQDQCLKGMLLHRIYIYDANPLEQKVSNPLSGVSLDYGSTPQFAHFKTVLADLKKIPFVSLRLGDLVQRGWKIKKSKFKSKSTSITVTDADLVPEIQQKGVDMRIGLDIAALTLKKHVDVIVLVTADSDFVPAMKFARREGAQLYLVPLGNGLRDGMLEHADLVIDMPSYYPSNGKTASPPVGAPAPTKP